MKHLLRLVLAAALVASPAVAQQFPTVPDHTVIGRIGVGGSSGPSQAIPFTIFGSQILGNSFIQFTGPTTSVKTFTLPNASGTIAILDAIQTFTNKTFDTAATGNVLKINGTTISAVAGTGSVVLATSPTLVTPTLGVATATSVNKVAITAPATSATLTLIDGTTTTGPAASGTVMTLGNNETVTGVKTFGAAGNVGKLVVAGTTSGTTVLNATAVASGTLTLPAATDTIIGKATTDILTNKTFNSSATGNVLQVSGVTVSSGQYPGETTTGSATAGNVGEYVESVIASGSAVSLTTGTAKDVTTITLTAGDWDVTGEISYVTAASTSVTALFSSVSQTLNTQDFTAGRASGAFMAAVVPGAGTAFFYPIMPTRYSLSGSTTFHLVAQGTFTVSTLTSFGILRARRAR